MSRIAIIDDRPLTAATVATALSVRGRVSVSVVAPEGSDADVVAAVEALVPDLTLVDVDLTERSGLDLLDALVAAEVPVAALALAPRHPRLVHHAQHAGVSVFDKGMPFGDLVDDLIAIADDATAIVQLSETERRLLADLVQGRQYGLSLIHI